MGTLDFRSQVAPRLQRSPLCRPMYPPFLALDWTSFGCDNFKPYIIQGPSSLLHLQYLILWSPLFGILSLPCVVLIIITICIRISTDIKPRYKFTFLINV